MSYLSCADLRSKFIEFFADRGHQVVPSSSLVPEGDQTLLFTNAGMVQFKDVFLGRSTRSCNRAVTAQRCLRAGGKHNDLENVGYTARHHTFFEMLGNFSFGDYFKREAIQYAWEFLTVSLGLPAERLWVTVYEHDEVAAEIWLKDLGIDPRRFSRIGESDNFWSMADTGPCGPCTEIFFDHGEQIEGGPPGSTNADGDRFVEIWNLVFMQYDRSADGVLTPLPRPSVDTGMGLERLAAVMQGVHSNYDIDVFRNLIRAAADATGSRDLTNASLRVIADHIRACSFMVADGVMPSNEGSGYVLRRILRRAVRHGAKLGQSESFFHRLVAPVCAEMGSAYPVLIDNQAIIEQVIRTEEDRFALTLERGLRRFDAAVATLAEPTLPGEVVFQLYDTYGFPSDLTADIAREKHISIDWEGYERCMQRQQAQAAASGRFDLDCSRLDVDTPCVFTGYDYVADSARILTLLSGGNTVERLNAGEEGVVVLDRTPFYAQSGGQVGDIGTIQTDSATFEVIDTQKAPAGSILHHGRVVLGSIQVGSDCRASVNPETRSAIAANHSATHLLHAALRNLLGPHVSQKGSLVDGLRLRFDFAHPEPLRREELEELERLVNAEVRRNSSVVADYMSKEAALASGAMALFGEKYGDEVRVLRIGNFSTELCGGTHVQRSGDIGLFKIVAEGGVASGVRRIEAVTGALAVEWVLNAERVLDQISEQLHGPRDELERRIGDLLEREREMIRDVERLQSRLAFSQLNSLVAGAQTIGTISVVTAVIEDADVRTLRELIDQIRNKLGPSVVVLAVVESSEKAVVLVGVSKDLTASIHAGQLVGYIAGQIGGKGGGRADLAQAGGAKVELLPAALASVTGWISDRTGSLGG